MKEIKSYSKINLGLYVTKKRSDGYHELSSIFLPLEFSDNIKYSESKDFSLNVTGPRANDFPINNSNSMYKAYSLIKKKFNINKGLTINIEKNIPAFAGLGGGSSNAASCLKICNDIYSLNLNSEDLRKIAKSIGADVPFFIDSVPSYVEGIGDIIKPFSLKRDYWIIILKPSFGMSTAKIYNSLDLTLENMNVKNRTHLERIAFQGMNNTEELRSLKNDLESVSVKLEPSLQTLLNHLKSLNPIVSMMTGSGSAVYGLFDKEIKGLENEKEFLCKTKILRGTYGNYRNQDLSS